MFKEYNETKDKPIEDKGQLMQTPNVTTQARYPGAPPWDRVIIEAIENKEEKHND